MSVLPLFMKHLDRFVRKYVNKDDHYVLTLDGHGSRKGFQWIEACMENKCEVVLAPANTSHFLQPCNQDIKKAFNKHVRELRDEPMKEVAEVKSIGLKLMCGVKAYAQISVEKCVTSFCKTGIFPFQREFAKRFQAAVIELDKSTDDDVPTESQVVECPREILLEVSDPARTLQRLTILLQNNKTTNSIVMSLRPRTSISSASTQVSGNNVALICGTPAVYLTLQDAVTQRKERLEHERQKALEKERQEVSRQPRSRKRQKENSA